LSEDAIKARFQLEFGVPVDVKLSFFTRHPKLVSSILACAIMFGSLFAVCVVLGVVVAFESFFTDLFAIIGLQEADAVAIIATAVITVGIFGYFFGFHKGILRGTAEFAPEGAVELLKPLKREIVAISVRTKIATVRLKHPSTERIDVLSLYLKKPLMRFCVDLYSTKPIDETRLKTAVEELKRQGWKEFTLQLKQEGVIELEFSGVEGVSPLNQILPKMMEMTGVWEAEYAFREWEVGSKMEIDSGAFKRKGGE
jgi:hypothetical protein